MKYLRLVSIQFVMIVIALGCAPAEQPGGEAPTVEPTTTGPPNILLVMVDDMGYAGISCFGNPYFKTPQIDRLAAEGMRLTQFYSASSVCTPSRAALVPNVLVQGQPLHRHLQLRRELLRLGVLLRRPRDGLRLPDDRAQPRRHAALLHRRFPGFPGRRRPRAGAGGWWPAPRAGPPLPAS